MTDYHYHKCLPLCAPPSQHATTPTLVLCPLASFERSLLGLRDCRSVGRLWWFFFDPNVGGRWWWWRLGSCLLLIKEIDTDFSDLLSLQCHTLRVIHLNILVVMTVRLTDWLARPLPLNCSCRVELTETLFHNSHVHSNPRLPTQAWQSGDYACPFGDGNAWAQFF